MRVVTTRTGVVLSESGGALEKMLPPFKLGVGGPVAGGRQYVPWIHTDDVVGALIFCLDTDAASGPVNLAAPEPVTNKELSKALGRVLKRPAVAPVPGVRGEAALRRDGADRDHRRADGAVAPAGARLRLRPAGPRAGAADGDER